MEEDNNINNTNTPYNHKEQCKLWYIKNKEKHLANMKEKIDCNICKCKIVQNQIRRHEKSAKHIKNVELSKNLPKPDLENFDVYKRKAIEYDKLREMLKELKD